MRFYDYDVECLMRFYVEAFVPKLFKILNEIPLRRDLRIY